MVNLLSGVVAGAGVSAAQSLPSSGYILLPVCSSSLQYGPSIQGDHTQPLLQLALDHAQLLGGNLQGCHACGSFTEGYVMEVGNWLEGSQEC